MMPATVGDMSRGRMRCTDSMMITLQSSGRSMQRRRKIIEVAVHWRAREHKKEAVVQMLLSKSPESVSALQNSLWSSHTC